VVSRATAREISHAGEVIDVSLSSIYQWNLRPEPFRQTGSCTYLDFPHPVENSIDDDSDVDDDGGERRKRYLPSDFNVTKLMSDPALMAIDRTMRKCLRFRPEDRLDIWRDHRRAVQCDRQPAGGIRKWRREREMEDGRMMEEKREAEESDDEVAAERTGQALRGRTRRDGVAAERQGRVLKDRTRRDGVAVERRGRVLEDRTRRDGIADEKDRAGARGKNTFDGI
jgi:hypothetical protein